MRNTLSVFFLSAIALIISVPSGSAQDFRSKIQRVPQEWRTGLRRGPHSPDEIGRKVLRLNAVLARTGELLRNLQNGTPQSGSATDELTLLKGERHKLELLDQEFSAVFQQRESELRRIDAQAKISALREFVEHYRAQMHGLQSGVDALLCPGTNPASSAAKVRAGELWTNLSKATSVNQKPQVSGVRTVGAATSAAHSLGRPPAHARRSHTSTTAASPTDADLAESKVVQLTPEIRAKAADLGNSPVKLYQYVRNNFDFEPYFGMMQNSQAVLWSGHGNDFDQATLLIALLRAANTPARYVRGTIHLPADQTMNWLGVKDRAAAARILSLTAPSQDLGDVFRLDHTWVEAWVDTGNGNAWVALDPSFKLRQYRPGIKIPKPLFARMNFLSTQKSADSVLATDAYLDQIRRYLQSSNPGAALSDLAYTGPVIADESSALPATLPYLIEDGPVDSPEMDRSFHHRVVVTLDLGFGTNHEFVTADLSIAEVCLQSITVSFVGATPHDQALIDARGGLPNTDWPWSYNLLPQIRVDDTVLATGTTPQEIPCCVAINAAYFQPQQDQPAFTSVTGAYTADIGSTSAIGIGGPHLSQKFLDSRIDRLLERTALGVPPVDEVGREMMAIAANRYVQRWYAEQRRVSDAVQFRFIQAQNVYLATTMAGGKPLNLFDRPFVLTPSQLSINVDGGIFDPNKGFIDINPPDGNTAGFKTFLEMLYLAGSTLENEIWEEVALTPAVSTTKALEAAFETGVDVLTINNDNMSDIQKVDARTYGLTLAFSIIPDIAAGNTVILPVHAVKVDDWTGAGWISETPSGLATMWIQQGTINSSPAPTGSPAPQGGGYIAVDVLKQGVQAIVGFLNGFNTVCAGDPVTLSNGNLFHQFDDANISSRGFPILLRRTYNSQSAYNGPLGYQELRIATRFPSESGR